MLEGLLPLKSRNQQLKTKFFDKQSIMERDSRKNPLSLCAHIKKKVIKNLLKSFSIQITEVATQQASKNALWKEKLLGF